MTLSFFCIFLLALWSVPAQAESLSLICSPSTSLSSPAFGHAGVARGDQYALFVGGVTTGGAARTTAEIFDADTGEFSSYSFPALGRFHVAGVTSRNYTLIAGGARGQNPSAEVDSLSVNTAKAWNLSTTTNLAEPRFLMAATAVGNFSIFAGGSLSNDSSATSSAVDIYNTALGGWAVSNPGKLSMNRTALAATSVGGRALFAGGEHGGSLLSTVDVFHSANFSWTNYSSLSSPRSRLAATSVGGMAFFAGGMGSNGASDVVDIYHLANSSWTTARLSQARYALTAVTFGDLAIFAGGLDSSGAPSAVMDIYNASSHTWTTGSLPRARWGLASVAVGRYVIFAGGNSASGAAQTGLGDIGIPVGVVDICELYPTPPSTTVGVVEAQVNRTFPQFTITEEGSPTKERTLTVEFASVSEFAWDGSVVRSVLLQEARWKALNVTNSSTLVGDTVSQFVTQLSETESLVYTFFTFADQRQLSLANNFSFAVSPAFFKFSISLNQWNWTSPGNRLQFVLELRQQFDSSLVLPDTPQEDTTSMFLFSRAGSEEGALIRLLEFGLTNASQVVPCSISLSEGRLISITFDYFDTSLEYDPDFSLLVDKASSGSDDSPVWIAAVVIVPVAVLLVLLIIGISAMVATILKRRRANQLKQVNFDGIDEKDAAQI